MLDVAVDREVEGDLLLADLGHGLPLRAGAFDGAISISAVQWLCNAVRCVEPLGAAQLGRLPGRANLLHAPTFPMLLHPTVGAQVCDMLLCRMVLQDSRGADPRRRLQRFFQTLYACLSRGARAVLQVPPPWRRCWQSSADPDQYPSMVRTCSAKLCSCGSASGISGLPRRQPQVVMAACAYK